VEAKYIGTGTKAYSYLRFLEADVCAMTTPGLDVLQIKRSKGVKLRWPGIDRHLKKGKS